MTFVAQRVALQDNLLLCNGDLHHYELKFLHCELVPLPVKSSFHPDSGKFVVRPVRPECFSRYAFSQRLGAANEGNLDGPAMQGFHSHSDYPNKPWWI